MSYFVIATFDIKDGSSENYRQVYEDIAALGLRGSLASDGGTKCQLPTTTTAGTFTGVSAAAVRDDLSGRIEHVFHRHGLKGEIFVAVGGDWAWGMRNP